MYSERLAHLIYGAADIVVVSDEVNWGLAEYSQRVCSLSRVF